MQKDIRSIVTELGGSAAVAKFLHRPQPTVCSWMARNSIPYRHWKAFVDLAHRRRVRGISIDTLWNLHIAPRWRT
jgi:hypothetical protein